MYYHLTTVPLFLGERLILTMALPIAAPSFTLVVCAGNSSWHGRGACAVGGAEDELLDMISVEHKQVERERDAAQFLHFLRELT